MAHIEDILFPVDLSESCRRTAPFVRSLASRTGARVTVLHVMELPQEKYADRPPLQSVVNVRSILRHRRHQIREFLVTELHSLPAAHFIMRHGDPARIIVDYASKRNVDLIMMPTHGVGLFRRWLLGSVTAKVLHDAACPVWTNAHVQEAASWLNPDRCLKILCAVDLTEKSLCVMGYGAQLAQTFGAELQLVHVVPASESLTVKYFDTELVAALSETAREQASKLQNEAGTNAQVLIRSGDVGHVVGQAALECQADLIVIGRGVLQETLGRLRTESYSIIRDSPCPVLSV